MSREKIKDALLVCLGQVLVYALICFNIRAVAQAYYLGTAVSDAIFATVNFLIIRRITTRKRVKLPKQDPTPTP